MTLLISETLTFLTRWSVRGEAQSCGGAKIGLLSSSKGWLSDGVRNYSEDSHCTWVISAPKSNGSMNIRLHFKEFAMECIFSGHTQWDGYKVRSIPEVLATSGYMLIHFYSDMAYNAFGFNLTYAIDACPSLKHDLTCFWTWNLFRRNMSIIVFIMGPEEELVTKKKKRCDCFEGYVGESCSQSLASGYWKKLSFSDPMPPRSSHASVLSDDNKIWIIGGETFSHPRHILSYIKSSGTNQLEWKRVHFEGEKAPSPRYGHTAVIHDNRSTIFLTMSGKLLRPHGYPVRGGFGHSAAYDPVTKLIYVYGGYVSTGWNSAALSQDLYSYDNIDKKWKLHQSSNSFRYLHSSVISQGLMIVYGGNTYNVTSWSHETKCFSSDILAYDIACDHWFSMDDSLPADFDVDLPRFGHTATMINKSMAILGGFDGVLKKDLFMYVPGECQTAKTKNDCLNYKPGIKCIWNKRKEFCEAHPSHLLHSSKLLDSVDVCQIDEHHTNSLSGFCSKLSACSACLSTSVDCVWCQDGCSYKFCKRPTSTDSHEEFNKGTSLLDYISKEVTSCKDCSKTISEGDCNRLHTCHSCQVNSLCHWVTVNNNSVCELATQNNSYYPSSNTKLPMENLMEETGYPRKCTDTCLCIDQNAYLSAFPYGQCMDWTTTKDKCPKNDSLAICADYQTCTSCRSNPACGWCEDGSRTGFGSCHIGGASGPLKLKEKRENHWALDNDICPASKGKQWHFTSCPNCQCNGHSKCSTKEKVCDDCLNHTTGEHCQKCTKGYFGNPVNGGKCRPCKCNEQAEECDHRTGKCICFTKGIIGDHCDKCDNYNNYFGNPKNGTCFFDLTSDYRFTFSIIKPEDYKYNVINFKNTLIKADIDVGFSIECSIPAKVDMAYTQTKSGVEKSDEMKLFSNYNCSEKIQRNYTEPEFLFGPDVNTTFYVYVHELQPPLRVFVEFYELPHPKSGWRKFLDFFWGYEKVFDPVHELLLQLLCKSEGGTKQTEAEGCAD
ncbi:unnamed protein product [Lepeophtheirus salmonis]|uniref:(salmon louse) hypothetical protein n=1 Tax=Lepeophtheirus salmonis TaxID=72036 RepID=A0A7R8D3C3_LEPSM|nr:unnamed protein product [Lepeophtheirus salmonis]CAF3015602.1 unnamed protein product [Lepeophtheirus salmonis]